MVCRCNNSHEHAQRAVENERNSAQAARKTANRKAETLEAQVAALTPDNTKFRILKVEPVSGHLVLKVEYPNCKTCSYEGVKVMIFQGITTNEALLWETLDPHFSEPSSPPSHVAPAPYARFPASEAGWDAAIRCAESM